MKMVHVTILTSKMEDSIRFYQEVVGLHVVADMRKNGGIPVFLGDDECSVRVELIESMNGAYDATKGLSIGFHVDDVEATREEMAQKGLNPTPVISPNPHVKFFYVKDPNGVEIQFI